MKNQNVEATEGSSLAETVKTQAKPAQTAPTPPVQNIQPRPTPQNIAPEKNNIENRPEVTQQQNIESE